MVLIAQICRFILELLIFGKSNQNRCSVLNIGVYISVYIWWFIYKSGGIIDQNVGYGFLTLRQYRNTFAPLFINKVRRMVKMSKLWFSRWAVLALVTCGIGPRQSS